MNTYTRREIANVLRKAGFRASKSTGHSGFSSGYSTWFTGYSSQAGEYVDLNLTWIVGSGNYGDAAAKNAEMLEALLSAGITAKISTTRSDGRIELY
jgi:hypothetical protein